MRIILIKGVNFASNIAMKKIILLILISIFFCTLPVVRAQSLEPTVSVELGKNAIALSEPFTVSVTIPNAETIPTIVFPELKGFQKRGTSRSGITKIVGGKSSEVSTFTQDYYALKEGTYAINAFSVLVNGQAVKAEGTEIVVGKSGENVPVGEGQDLVELENEATQGAFFTVTVRKRAVYVGEGFNLSVSFFVSENNTAEMDFYETDKQLEKILKQIKPANCWEENFGIKEIQPIPVKIRNKSFTEYRIYQATFFPFNNQTIKIPTVGLTMKIGDGEAKEKETLQMFYSKPIEIRVVNLPAHPLKNQVLVGNLRLEESLKTTKLTTGKSYEYDFKIAGEGNISAIQSPVLESNNTLFDVYPPDIEQGIGRRNGQVTGYKKFHYQLIPKRSGVFELGQIFELIFFNTNTEKYDTLRSNMTVQVSGQALAQTGVVDKSPASFYEIINESDSKYTDIDYQLIIKNITNFLIVAMLLGMIYVFRKNG